MKHPRDRAERRRLKEKKDYGYDRELAVQQRLEEEAAEQRKALEELKGIVGFEEPFD
jgi:hypothetical protein